MALLTTIVGCGAVAQRLYRKPLQQLEKRGILKVAALVDPVEEHAAALGSAFPGARRFADLTASLAAERPQLTLVLSPAHLHAAQVIEAVGHGSHILCEKPMATSTADCDRMNAAAKSASRILAVGMIRRFFPAFAQLVQIIRAGRLGAIRRFEYREGHKFEWEVTTPAAFRARHLGGTGVLFDIGPHVVDHLAWTFGDLQVTGYADDAMDGIESNAHFEVRTDQATGSIHLSWDSPQSNELRVYGAEGEAVLRIDRFDQLALRGPSGYQPQTVTHSFPADLSTPAGSSLVPKSYPQAVFAQLVSIARAITTGEPPAVDGESGRTTVAVLERALEVAEPLPMPWLSAAEQEAFARLHWKNTR